MDGINIKEFVKENESMTQMEINKDIAETLNDLKDISEMVDNVINNKAITNFVCAIPVGCNISNPVKDFYRDCKCGNYDNLTDEQYNEKLEDMESLGLILDDSIKYDRIVLDVRDNYVHLVNALIEAQKSVKQIYDVAMLVEVLRLIENKESE